MNKARATLNDAIAILDAIPHDVSLPNNAHFRAASTSTILDPSTTSGQEEANVSASSPPVSTTKGSRKSVRK